jgi:carbon storage regulator
MLVMTRKKNESIVVNNDVVITVIEIRGDKIRLGISCPKDVPVHRSEVFEAIHGKLPNSEPPTPISLLERDVAGLVEQTEKGDQSVELKKLLAAKRLQLAALRSQS